MDGVTSEPLGEAVAFFHDWAGYSSGPDETPEEGRMRCAVSLAMAEAWLALQDGSGPEWEIDEHADRSGIEHSEPLWCCRVYVACKCQNRCCSGERSTSLCGIDLGTAGPDGMCARIVVAQLAAELKAEGGE